MTPGMQVSVVNSYDAATLSVFVTDERNVDLPTLGKPTFKITHKRRFSNNKNASPSQRAHRHFSSHRSLRLLHLLCQSARAIVADTWRALPSANQDDTRSLQKQLFKRNVRIRNNLCFFVFARSPVPLLESSQRYPCRLDMLIMRTIKSSNHFAVVKKRCKT